MEAVMRIKQESEENTDIPILNDEGKELLNKVLTMWLCDWIKSY